MGCRLGEGSESFYVNNESQKAIALQRGQIRTKESVFKKKSRGRHELELRVRLKTTQSYRE